MSMIDAKLLVTWLKSGVCDRGNQVKLLFTSMPGGTASKHALKHNVQDIMIPDSIHFDFQSEFADPHSTLSNTMCSNAQFQTQARKIGLNNHDTLVIYDNYGNFCASRVWFMCKAMGFNNVYVLNGGLPKWVSENKPTVPNVFSIDDKKQVDQNQVLNQETTEKGKFIVKPNLDFQFVDQNYIQSLISSPAQESNLQCIVDARSNARFSGVEPDPRKNVRSGHIPGSYNLHYAQLQDKWGGFLPLNQLRSVFNGAGLNSDQYVFTCGSGVTACILAQAAHMLNYRPLKVYDGSWSEWGANNDLAITQGQK